MRAVRLDGPGAALRLVEVPIPEPSATEVRIRVAGCGVCHTDLHVVDGTQHRVDFPLILGHEVSGWIDATGPEADVPLAEAGLAVGDAVLVHGGWGCGSCRECSAGAPQRCPTGRAPGFQAAGGYAELMLVPHPLHLVPLGSMDAVRAAPLADAGLTSYRAVRRAGPWLRPGTRALLIGAGGLGQFALQYLRLSTDLVVAVSELSAGRAQRARELGADAALVDPDAGEVREALNGPAEVVLDFVGSDASAGLATEVVASDGLVVLVGEAGGELRAGFDQPAVEAWLTTAAWGSIDDMREVVALARAGRLKWDVEVMDLASASAAHDRVRSAASIGRVVLAPGSQGR